MIKLILKLKDAEIEEFAFAKDQINIGRSKENDIVIDNIAVSRRHAQIEKQEGKGYVLRDLNSSNGTLLNNVQIDANDHALQDGAVIGIGKFEIVIKGLSQTAEPDVKGGTQEEAQGTMIFDAVRRKPSPEPKAAPEAPGIRWPTMTATEGPWKGKEFKISKELTTLGKGPEDDIPAKGWFVSSSHAKITRRGERFYILPPDGFLASTKVNGVAIKREHILKNKDQISIGDCSFVFTQT
jgi:pSer/pThr/pTyr-binding forkhead associated (FHA) protein